MKAMTVKMHCLSSILAQLKIDLKFPLATTLIVVPSLFNSPPSS